MTETNTDLLREGQKMPNFELPDEGGLPYGLFEHLQRGPLVLVFYRGDW
jgi:peroxiredoxin